MGPGADRLNAQTIMICSGKGGTGKSTVAVLLGAELGRRGKRVLLIELDSGLRSVDVIAGVYGKTVYDIEDVLCGRCDGDKAVVQSPLYPGLSVISAPYEGGEVRSAPLARLVLAMRGYFDFILFDTAAGMGAPFTAAAQLAEQALLVLTPDPVALRDGRIVADALIAGHHTQKSVRLIVNRVNAPELWQKRAGVRSGRMYRHGRRAADRGDPRKPGFAAGRGARRRAGAGLRRTNRRGGHCRAGAGGSVSH